MLVIILFVSNYLLTNLSVISSYRPNYLLSRIIHVLWKLICSKLVCTYITDLFGSPWKVKSVSPYDNMQQRSARAGRPAGRTGPGLDIKSRSRAGPGLICAGPGRRIRPVQITVITVCLQLHNNASINRSSARDPSMLLMLFTHVCVKELQN